MEENESDLRRGYSDKLGATDEPCFKERPSTTGGRIFGTVSEDLHSNYKPKTSRLDLPSGCICREEIKRLEKEI